MEEKRKALHKVLDSMGIVRDGEPKEGEVISSDDPVALQRYREAQEQYEADRAQFEKLRLEYQGERIQLGLPRNPVVIHEEPTVPRVPVSPNVSINLLLGLVAGIPLGLLLALPLIWLVDAMVGRKN